VLRIHVQSYNKYEFDQTLLLSKEVGNEREYHKGSLRDCQRSVFAPFSDVHVYLLRTILVIFR
jgi:hypothetical protein